MTESAADAVMREKLLYQYTSAVERGEFDTAAAILAQAESDPQLEEMIIEINAALAGELPPVRGLPAHPTVPLLTRIATGLRKLAPGVGLSALVLVLVVGVLALIGPAIGNTFENAVNLPLFDSHARFVPVSTANVQGAPNGAAPYVSAAEPTVAYIARPTTAAAAAYAPATSYPVPESAVAAQATATPYATQPARTAAIPTNQPRMVARSGYLIMTVVDTRKSRDTVTEIIAEYAGEGAFILSSNEQAVVGSDQPAIFVRLRVPVARYDAVMNRLVGLALTVDSREEHADDVTADYVDAQARIRELETAIERLLEIARTAENTEDLLTVEKALSERRAELEAMKGRAQYLSQTAALSLIQFELRPKIIFPTLTPTPMPTPEAWRPGDTAQRSILVLLNDLRRLGDWLITFGITTLPWFLAVGLVGFGGYRLWSRRRK